MESGITAQFGAARVLYGMGRDNAIPRRFFGVVSLKTAIPRNNVMILGVVALIDAFSLTYERGAELLNFGAFIAFMGVNIAALVHYKFRSQEKVMFAAAVPLLGFSVCGFIWLNLNRDAQFLGAIWLALGLIIYFVTHRGSRHRLPACAKNGGSDGS